MTVERIHKQTPRTPEEKARLQAIRERFQAERPTSSALVASGEYDEPIPHGDYLGLQQAIAALKEAREEAGLSLTQVAEKSGIDKAALSRLETGRQINPTVATLSRYAKAVGKRLQWTVEDVLPIPSHVTGAGTPGSQDPDPPWYAPGTQHVIKRTAIIKVITRAYVDVRGPELLSTDRIIADPELDSRFLERCRELGATGRDFDLNWSLFNARKAGRLGDIPSAKKFSIPREELDQFLFASEMAFRILQDQHSEAGRDLSLDKVICDPELATEFDTIASRLAPGFSSLQYRWGALALRKAAGRLRKAAERAKCPEFTNLGSIRNLNTTKLPTSPGLYLIGTEDRPLFVNDTLNIRNRIERHLQYGEGRILPNWVFADPVLDAVDIAVHLVSGPESRHIQVMECKAKQSYRPLFNVVE